MLFTIICVLIALVCNVISFALFRYYKELYVHSKKPCTILNITSIVLLIISLVALSL